MKQTTLRIITGLIILGIGVGAFLGALDVIPFWSAFGSWWPALLIIGGALALIGDIRTNYLWGGVTIVIGAMLLLRSNGVIDFNVFSLILPIVIIAVGLSILISSQVRKNVPVSSGDTDEIAAIFSGSETVNQSQNYKGGRLTAVFGGIVIDLRDAKIEKDARLDVFVLCGGVELKVPRDLKVVSKITPIAGGVENKSQGNDKHNGPVLVLTGTVALGGIEVKT